MKKYLVVKDEEGELRPLAGIWQDSEFGKMSADDYISKNPDCSIAICNLQEENE